MDQFGRLDKESERKRIDRYLSSRHFYSAKNRKEAAKFKRKKIIKKRVHTIAKLNEELKRCQEIYLNCCIHEIGSAHRLAQLIEKVEQISIPDVKKSDLQGSNFKKPQSNFTSKTTNKFKTNHNKSNLDDNSKLIKKAFQNEIHLNAIIEKEKQLTNDEQLERSLRLSNNKSSIKNSNTDLVNIKKGINGSEKVQNLLKSSKQINSEFDFIYSINEQAIVHTNQMSKLNNQYSEKSLNNQMSFKQQKLIQQQVDNLMLHPNNNDRKTIKQQQIIESSKLQILKKETMDSSKNSFDTDIEDPFSISFKELADDQNDSSRKDKRIIDERIIEEQIIDKQISNKQISNKQISNKQISNKQIRDKQISNKQINDKKLNDKQTMNTEQINEVNSNNLNKESKKVQSTKKSELKLIKSLELSEESFEEKSNLKKVANFKSSNYSDHISKTCTDYKLNTDLDNDLSDSNLNSFKQNSNQNFNLDYQFIGKDVIKSENNEIIVKFNKNQIKKQANNETKSKIVTNQDYNKHSLNEQSERTIKTMEEYFKSCDDQFDTVDDHQVLNQDKVNQVLNQEQVNQNKTNKKLIKKYSFDYLDQNLSIPSLNSSLKEKINLIDLVNDDDLPDLIISPTLSSSSFPSIESLCTLISSSNDNITTVEKCTSCSKKIVKNKKSSEKIENSKQNKQKDIDKESKKDAKNVFFEDVDKRIKKNSKKYTKLDAKKDATKKDKQDIERNVDRDVQKVDFKTDFKKDTNQKFIETSSHLNFNFETFWDDIFKDSSKDKLTDLNHLKSHFLTKFKKRLNHH